MNIDLRKEQLSTLARPRLKYGFTSKLFFWGMDLVAGKENDLSKAKLLEILACIPYREWQIRQYAQLTFRYFNRDKINWARDIIEWGRDAQDNEYMHLLVIQEKMREDGLKDKWYLATPVVFVIVAFYLLLSRMLAWVNIKGAFKFNAEFEDHAEHIYAKLVKNNPGLENQIVTNPIAKEYADVETWADIFRRIGLDERDHRNHSFYFAGVPERMEKYEGMPIMTLGVRVCNY
jgi:hypothetical protein